MHASECVWYWIGGYAHALNGYGSWEACVGMQERVHGAQMQRETTLRMNACMDERTDEQTEREKRLSREYQCLFHSVYVA